VGVGVVRCGAVGMRHCTKSPFLARGTWAYWTRENLTDGVWSHEPCLGLTLLNLTLTQASKVPPWGLVDDHALEDTATCQRLLLLLLPEGKPSIELAESLAKDFNCSYDRHPWHPEIR